VFENTYQPIEIRGRKLLDVHDFDTRHDPAESIRFTYYVKTEGDLKRVTAKIAEEETTGGWLGQGEPTDTFKLAQAEPVRIEQYGPGEGVVTIQAPLANLDPEADPFYQVQMLSVGGPILEFVFYTDVAFLDFDLPPALLKRFPGPKFGIQRSREVIGLGPDEPLMGTIIKPCCGLTVQQAAEKIYEAALGGCVLMKDDEKMMNPAYCPLEPKVKAIAEKLARAAGVTGKRVIYCPHLPVRADRLLETARRVADWGATGIMFNVILAGNISAMQIVAESDLDIPIYAHCGGLAALTTGPRRIDARVIAKLVRLCGGDYFQIGVMGQKGVHVNSLDESLLAMLAETLREPVDGIRDTVPVTAGGLGAKNLGLNLQAFHIDELGYALAPLAGSNVLGHPMGPRAGAVAMAQAADAYYAERITDPAALRAYADRTGSAELAALFA